MLERMAQIYRDMSDDYLEKGEYLPAVQALADGAGRTGNETLTDRKEYLRENIVVANKREYFDDGSFDEYVYDESGNKIKEIDYDSNGSVLGKNEITYDIVGNIISINSPIINAVYEYQYTYIGE